MSQNVNAHSGIPLYKQLISIIKNDIRSGVYKTGDKIPSETELCQRYQVSRITVRNAINELVEEELLFKTQGKGTFVAEPKYVRPLNKSLNFTNQCRQIGRKPSSKVISVEQMPATDNLAEMIGVKPQETIIKITRVRYADDLAVMLETTYFSQHYHYLCDCDLSGSLYEILGKHNVYPDSATKSLGICYASKDDSLLLSVPPFSAMLLIKEQVFDKDGQIIHYCKQVLCSERWPYRLTVHSNFQ